MTNTPSKSPNLRLPLPSTGLVPSLRGASQSLRGLPLFGAKRPAADPILPPYTPDPTRPAAQRGRLWVYLGVMTFSLIWGFGFALFAPFGILFFAAPIPILAFITIWALPDTRSAPLQTLSAILFAFMAGLVLWPNYLALAPQGLPWITVTRMIGIPLVFIYAICASMSPDLRRQSAAALRSTPIIAIGFIGFTILELVSIVFSKSILFSVEAFINAQLNWTFIFLASLYVFQKPGRIERMLRFLWAMSVPIGMIAIVEFRVGHPLWAGHIPSFLQINDPTVKMMMAGRTRGGIYKAASTFGNSLGLGEFVSLMMPVVLNFLVGPYRTLTRIAAGFSVPFLLVVVVLSGARLGLIGCFLSFFLMVVVGAMQLWRRNPGSLLAPTLIYGSPPFSLVALVASFVIGGIRVRVWGGGGDGSAMSTDARKEQWAIGLPKFLNHPWGYGIGNAAETLGYAPHGLLTIDTYYLSILLEYGIVGFVLYYGMFLAAIIYGGLALVKFDHRTDETVLLKPLTISVANFFVIKSVFSEHFNHPIVFMMLAMIVALVYRAKSAGKAEAAAPLQADQRVRARPGYGRPVLNPAHRLQSR